MPEETPSTPSETTASTVSPPQGPPDEQPPPREDDQQTNQGATAQAESPPYGMFVALVTLGLISIVALAAMLIFRDLFKSATEVSTVLGSLFAVVGTVVGAYFGIKTSGDTRDKMQGSIDSANEMTKELQVKIDRANELSNRALAELDRETSRRILKDMNESER